MFKWEPPSGAVRVVQTMGEVESSQTHSSQNYCVHNRCVIIRVNLSYLLRSKLLNFTHADFLSPIFVTLVLEVGFEINKSFYDKLRVDWIRIQKIDAC